MLLPDTDVCLVKSQQLLRYRTRKFAKADREAEASRTVDARVPLTWRSGSIFLARRELLPAGSGLLSPDQIVLSFKNRGSSILKTTPSWSIRDITAPAGRYIFDGRGPIVQKRRTTYKRSPVLIMCLCLPFVRILNDFVDGFEDYRELFERQSDDRHLSAHHDQTHLFGQYSYCTGHDADPRLMSSNIREDETRGSLFWLVTPGESQISKPASNAKEQPIKNDRVLRTKLKQASKNVPKYLFRMWDARSGGSPKLNTTSAITPLAFASSRGHKSVYDMTLTELFQNVDCHLAGDDNVRTEGRQCDSVHVAIIDTEELAKTNTAFHVPALGKIIHTIDEYEEEYLVHGVIEGEFYKAVSYRKLCDLGLLKQLPTLNRDGVDPFNTLNIRAFPGDEVNYTIDELRLLRKIALPYGEYFSLPMAIVLFCCKKRPGYWSKISTTDLETIIKVLGGWNEIPLDWASSRSLFSKNIYPANWDANKQVQNLMHALFSHCYGKGARGNEARYAAKIKAGDEDDITGAMASMSVGGDHDADEASASRKNKKMLRKPAQKRV
ncbi:hypothetical protein KCU62_g4381, partial [Aureobasidium sp. EXF-3399]